jgi:hypothetical protein
VFSPNGHYVAAGSGCKSEDHQRLEGLFQVWDSVLGRELAVRHLPSSSFVQALAFSPDGKTVASGHFDGPIRLWEVATWKERYRLDGHQAGVRAVSFSPNGRVLASASDDTTALLWDAWADYESVRHDELEPATIAKLWSEMADSDAANAFRAMRMLAASPKQAVRWIESHLAPVVAPNPVAVARMIEDLNHADFAERERAQRGLQELGELVERDLRRAGQHTDSAEVRRRISHLQARMHRPEWLREGRVAELLEHIGTPKAVRVLQALSNGVGEAYLTHDAFEALRRLARHP